MKRRDFTKNLILDWLLLVPGLLGSVFCLITAFSLPASGELWAISISAVTLFSVCLGYSKQDRITIPLLLVAMAIPAYLFRVELVESFRNLWGVLSASFAKGYDFFRDYVPRESTTKETVGTALLCLTVLEAFFCCVAVRVWKRTTPAALALLLCVAPCFVLTDTPPDTLPLLVVIFSILTQAFSQSVRRRAAGEQGKAILTAAILSVMILGLLISFFPQESYSPPITWDELAQKMEHWKQKQNNRGNVNAGLTGNPLSVDLSGLGALPNRPFPVFSVKATEDCHLYLRGSSYTDFDGTVWARNTEENWERTVVFPYWGKQDGVTLTVETVEAEPLLYTTYQLVKISEGALVSDTYLRNDAQSKKYTLQYNARTEPVTPDPLYDSWVWTRCLNLPDQTRTGVLSWWNKKTAQAKLQNTKDPQALVEYAEAVAEQISLCASYSRNPLQLPEDKDFCTWFLNEAAEGYCVHYASSCVALLRALGIPSRYVSGYVCDAIANRQTWVTNLQAHAWVEIWAGGRWVPIEPTPSDATEFTNRLVREETTPTDTQDTQASEETTKPTESRSVVPTTYAARDIVTSFERAISPEDRLPASNSKDDASKREPVDLTPLGIFLAVIGLPLLIVGRRRLKLRHWMQRYDNSDNNGKAQLLYRRMHHLEKYSGEKLPDNVIFLAKKASFSQHTLTEPELTAIRKNYILQVRGMSSLHLWKRVFYKYILAIY